jgi:4-hydroxybenzoate polyprenyltransferase
MSVRALLLHLRLNWQLILMPIFLWGFFLSGGPVGPKFWLGLFVFHVLFYGGSVAFNSYYDQDEGPIGGLWNPPRPTLSLLLFSLAIQVIGMVLVAAFINRALLVVALLMFVLSVAYSHPAIRLKARPWLGLLTVSLGQGIGGAISGWLCGQGDWTTLGSTRALLGLAVSTLITTGFYPLTQIYQRAEDARRGDVTFAVRMGERCFPFTIICFTAAAGLAAWLMWREYSPIEGLWVGAGLVGLAALVWEWWRHFDEAQTRQNYLRLMRIGYVMGVGFILYIGWRLVARA